MTITTEIRILLLDTQKIIKDSLSKALREKYDIKILIIKSEDNFKKYISNYSNTVIISEINNKNLSGLSALEIRNQIASKIPFIFYSTESDSQVIIDCFRMGATDYVIKPNLDELITSIILSLTTKRKYKDEENFTALFDKDLIGLYRITPKGKIIYANAALVEMLGFESLDELKKRNLEGTDFKETNSRKSFIKRINKEGVIKNFETSWIRKNGEIIIVSESAQAVKDNKGKVLYFEGTIEDITQRKTIEQKLFESNDELDQFFKNNLDLLCIADFNGYFRKLNPEWKKTLGYPIKYLIGKKNLDFVHPDDIDSTLLQMSKLSKNLPVTNFINRYRCKDGSYRWIEWRSTKVGDRIYAAARDITKTINYQNKIFESEQKFKVLSENAPIGIFRTNKFGKTTYVNPKWCEISGLNFEQAMGDGWLKAVHPDDRTKLIKNWEKSVRLTSHSLAEYRFIHPDGKIVWVQGRAIPQKNGNGKIVGYIGTISDITEQKLITQKLIDSELKFRTLFQSSTDAIFLMRNDIFVECNEMTLEIFGCKSKNDIINRSPYQFSPELQPDGRKSYDKAIELINLAINGIQQKFYWKHKKLNGTLFDAEVSLNKIVLNKEIFIQAIVRDITEKKKAEFSLKTRLERIQLLNSLNLNLQELLDIKEIIKQSYEIIPKYLKIDRVSIFFYSPELNGLISEKYIGKTIDNNISDYQPVTIGISGKCFSECKTIVIDDCSKSDIIPKRFIEELNLKSVIAIPLKAFGKCFGVIRIDYTKNYHSFSEDEIEFYELLGLHIGTIIRNSQLYTELLKTAQELKESNERYFLTIDAAEQGIWDWNVLTNEVFYSPQWKKQIGFEDHELKNEFETWVEHLHPDEKENCLIAVQQYLQNPKKHFILEFRFRHKNGTYRWIHNKASSIIDDKGKVVRMFGAHTDITEQKLAQDAIQESEEQFRTLFNSAADAIFIADLKTGKIIDANESACKLLQLPKEKILSLHHTELHPSNVSNYSTSTFKLHIIQTEKSDIVTPVENFVIRADGKVVPVEIVASRIVCKGKECLMGIFRDITERKKAGTKILESERKLRSFLETSFEGVCASDAKDNITYVNPRMCELLGYSANELLGNNFADFIAPEYFNVYYEQHKAREKSQSTIYELQLVTKKGDHIYTLISASPILGQNGEYMGSLGMFTDITDLKVKEEILKNSERRFRSIWENSFDAMRLTNNEGIIIDVNESFCRLFKKSRKHIIGNPFYLLYSNQSEENFSEEYIKNFNSGNVKPSFEAKIDIWNGEVKWVSLSNSFISDEQGNKLLLSIFRDITENKRAEEEIRKLYRGIENSPAIVVITDKDGIIEYVNPKFYEITGYAPAEVIGQKPSIIKSGLTNPEIYKQLWETISAGNVWEGEFLNRKKNGTLYWESALISPVFDENGEIINYIGIKEDITDKKQLIEDLLNAKEKAEESNQLKSSFLANMSHELRTPLIGILGFSEILIEESPDTHIKEQAEIIFKSGKRLLQTLNFILDYSKLESERVEPHFEIIDVVSIIKEVINLHTPNANKNNISLNFISEFNHLPFYTDQKLINSIVNNLINNAIKFTEKGFVNVSISKKMINDQGYFVLIIEDSGIGISKEKQAIIWEPFRQISEGKARTFQGTGLGLTIIKKYIEILNGFIELESELGKGSKFTIFLPYSKKG